MDFDPDTQRVAVTAWTGKVTLHRAGRYAEYAVLREDRVVGWARSYPRAVEIADAQDGPCDIRRTHLVAR